MALFLISHRWLCWPPETEWHMPPAEVFIPWDQIPSQLYQNFRWLLLAGMNFGQSPSWAGDCNSQAALRLQAWPHPSPCFPCLLRSCWVCWVRCERACVVNSLLVTCGIFLKRHLIARHRLLYGEMKTWSLLLYFISFQTVLKAPVNTAVLYLFMWCVLAANANFLG